MNKLNILFFALTILLTVGCQKDELIDFEEKATIPVQPTVAPINMQVLQSQNEKTTSGEYQLGEDGSIIVDPTQPNAGNQVSVSRANKQGRGEYQLGEDGSIIVDPIQPNTGNQVSSSKVSKR